MTGLRSVSGGCGHLQLTGPSWRDVGVKKKEEEVLKNPVDEKKFIGMW